MKTLIVANWKMNPITAKEAEALFNAVKRGIKGIKNVDVVLCPPFVFTGYGLPATGYSMGAQNVFYKEKGAFTGEISPYMLKDIGVDYVIIGHSERRKYFQETDEIINKKIQESLVAKLKVIICIGETTEEKDKKSEILENQLTQALQGIKSDELKNIVIAYEPVWAIGTGNNCSPDEAQKSILFIRKLIANLYNRDAADALKILYGGSVNSKNSASYIKEAGANGLLVGGASLNAQEFVEIVKSAA